MTEKVVKRFITTESGDLMEVLGSEYVDIPEDEEGSNTSTAGDDANQNENLNDSGVGDDDQENIIRLKLPDHTFLVNKRLTVLDQCKFLDSCIIHKAWEGKNMQLVKRDLECTSTIDTLKKLLDKYLKLFRQNELKSLKASGADDEKSLRQVLLQDIDDMMKDKRFETTKDDNNEKQLWAAKVVRSNAVSTLKEKCHNTTVPPPPPGSKGGKKPRLEQIASQLQEQQHQTQLNQYELEREKISLERQRLELEAKKEERRDKLAEAQIAAQNAISAILLVLVNKLQGK